MVNGCVAVILHSLLDSWHPANFADAIMSTHSHRLMKIKIGDANFIRGRGLDGCRRCSNVLDVCIRQDLLVLFGAKEIYGVYCRVFFRKVKEMTVKSWLRGDLGPCNLDLLTECLDPLLFPENCKSVRCVSDNFLTGMGEETDEGCCRGLGCN
jgi:hypothetical protein